MGDNESAKEQLEKEAGKKLESVKLPEPQKPQVSTSTSTTGGYSVGESTTTPKGGTVSTGGSGNKK
jgi:hypothetical protein